MTNPAVTLPYIFASESGNQPAGQLDANFNVLANQVNGSYSQTSAESIASVTPSNYSYAPGDVRRYGGDPTGVIDSTAAITSAIMQSEQTGGAAVFFDGGSYLTSSSIANLHTVFKLGTASIVRGANTFYFTPTSAQTNTLYVSTTGNDSNDGLTTSQPFLTLQAAYNAMLNYGFYLGGTWQISNPGGGTFAAGLTASAGFQSANYIEVLGATGALPFVPTSIVNAPASGAAFIGNGNNTFYFQDWLVSNCTNAGAGFGFVFQEFSELELSHVYMTGNDTHCKVQQGRLYIAQACYISGGITGIVAISQVTYTIGYGCSIQATAGNYGNAGVGLYITGCSGNGVLAQENGTGHFDYSYATGCGNYGLDIVCNSRANLNFSNVSGNTTGDIRLREASSWANTQGNTVGQVNEYAGGGDVVREGLWTVARRQPIDVVSIANVSNGTTTVKTYLSAIDIANFNIHVQKFYVRVMGTFAGTNNTKGIAVVLDATTLFSVTTANAAVIGWYELELEINAFNSTTQVGSYKFYSNGGVTGGRATLNVTPINGTITVVNTLTTGDTINTNEVEIWNEGGA